MRTNDLDSRMEMDHVISILPGGLIEDAQGIHAPELLMDSTDDGDILSEHEQQYIADAREQGWELESGWTGQYSYAGVCMHRSEYIGGRLAEHILCTPGYWVAFPVSMVLDMEPDGWALAFKPHERPSGAYRCPCCGDDFVGTTYVCQECEASGCEQSIDRTGEVGFWECSRVDTGAEPESGFVATINIPGYSPMGDDVPPVFETPAEAWEWLAEERERSEDEAWEAGVTRHSDAYYLMRAYAFTDHGPDTVYGDAPGYEGNHDLGLAYCVTATDE